MTFNDNEGVDVVSLRILIIVFLIMFAVLFASAGFVAYQLSHKDTGSQIVITEALDTSGFDRSDTVGSYVMSEEEFDTVKETENGAMQFATYEDYVVSATSVFTEATSTFEQTGGISEYNPCITATGANAKLYNYCDKYFQCFYGDVRISPIFPLAIANVETGGRADNTVTWSSLFPSRYVPIEKMDTFCITDVVADRTVFNALSKEYSTRDRGALQMSPTYGAGNQVINAKMSGTEVSKLSGVNVPPECLTWSKGASSSAGDRFYIPDVLLRLQAAMMYNVQSFVSSGYLPEDTSTLLCMMAVGHNSGSGVFNTNYKNKPVGNWKSGSACFAWCKLCGNPTVLTLIRKMITESDRLTIDNDTAAHILYAIDPSINYRDYVSSSVNAYYPIKFLYAYEKLNQLYTQ